MISNSFHSSAKSHSISSAGSLAKAERHNSRGYFSFYYDQSQITDLVGNASTLAADIENAINERFSVHVEEYNQRQKRAERKIQGTAFEHFEANKRLDIAAEAIFQIGDKESWSLHRDERIINHRGKNYVIKRFGENVKSVMNDIYMKQVDAYANIYQTHGQIILERILKERDAAETITSRQEAIHPGYKDIYSIPSKDRVQAIQNLPADEQAEYIEYAQARDTLAAIHSGKLVERIRNGQMHIEVINATSHYDEWSPHLHAISLCWADGYSTGLRSRLAKSVVLNRWAMEVLQERLHEIAEQELAAHPEIFQEEALKPKEAGRNYDYTTEQITRQNLAKLQEQNRKAQEDLNRLDGFIKAAWDAAADARQEKDEAVAAKAIATDHAAEAEEREREVRRKISKAEEDLKRLKADVADLQQVVGTIQTIDQYQLEADELEEEVILQEHNVADIEALENFAARRHREEAKIHADRLREAFKGSLEFMKRMLVRLFRYEEVTRMDPVEKRSPGLLDRVKKAERKVDRRPQEQQRDQGERD